MNNTKRLFSKLSIILFSAGSTFFAYLLYAQNLKETGNGKFITPTLVFSIIYSLVAYKLSLFINIPLYYSFFPLNLIGGLIMTGPFWNYQIGNLDNYERRKIGLPLLFFLIPIGLLLSFHFYDKKKNLNEFQKTAQKEMEKQMENQLYVDQDSSIVFYDIEVPLLSDSYTFQTKVEDVISLCNFKDYEDGRFSVVCIKAPFSDNEVFGPELLKKTFPEAIITNCKNKRFDNIICADFSSIKNDTTTIHGSASLIKVDKTIYQFFTQFTELDKSSADSLSYYLIDQINPVSSTGQTIKH